MDLLEAIRNSRSHNLRHADLHVPQARPPRLLGLGPPHAGDEDERRRDAGLAHAEEDPDDHQGRIAAAGGVAGDEDAPAGDVDAEVLGDGPALHEVGRDGLRDEVPDVEDGAEVVVVVAGQEVLDAHVGRVVEQRLVEVLQEVDGHEEGHDVEVDAPAQRPRLGDAQHDAGLLLAGEELERLIERVIECLIAGVDSRGDRPRRQLSIERLLQLHE